VQRRFVSLHGTIKRVELRVLSVGLRENPGAVCIAIAARLLAALRCVGNQYGDVAIGARADLLALLAARSAPLGTASVAGAVRRRGMLLDRTA